MVTRDADRQALAAMIERGVDLSRPANTLHRLNFNSPIAAKAATNELCAAGYSSYIDLKPPSSIWKRLRGLKEISLLVETNAAPIESAVFATTDRMNALAAKYGGDYEGWVTRQSGPTSNDIAPANLANGSRIDVDPWAFGDGRRQVAVRLLRKDGSADSVPLPYPRAGLAGGRIIVSPSERLAVLSIYSGQSEEGYELFGIADRLTHLGSLGYQIGEFASYCFSPDESLLVMALPNRCGEWWSPWDDGEAEPAGSGRLAFSFGQLRLHEVATAKISVHDLRINVAEGWEPARTNYDPDLRPVCLSAQTLQLHMPWGAVTISIPAPEVIVLPVD